ncbi:hypothetical protein EIP91_010329 [Steccherinum ochraceum]|uniref:MIF4G domain-containing protein n=1 Tax=Steccherinum ochraceum TaxID=92696 RepID=A0A4R0R631_9APHY|nr:hypothetical protein EIP91_010329 [Steccherinum ochraceum]
MSYHGGSHRRRHHHRDDGDPREAHETPEQKLKATILKLGEVDPVQEVSQIASHICTQPSSITSTVVEGLRIGVTEEPFKIPYYATLLRVLSNNSPTTETESIQGPEFGKQILEEFWKGFQTYLDQLAWREIRLCVQFFSHLVAAQVISSHSMYGLIRAIVVVLDEFGVSHGRARQAVRCASEGLMIAGRAFTSDPNTNISDILDPIRTYVHSASSPKRLVLPVASVLANTEKSEVAYELLDSALEALEAMHRSGFQEALECFPRPYSDAAIDGSPIFDLPSVLVPPEAIELEGISNDSEGVIKKGDWAEFYVRIFDNEVTPNISTPIGYFLRCGLLDIVDIFEVNRKECARLLLEYPKWSLPGTFQGKASEASSGDGKWQLECTVVESILGQLFLLPESTHKTVYYIALVTELCKLSPPTVGPAVGKSIRRMYGLLSDGLDAAVADRLANWFSIHMSNFNFMWVWKEWIGDLSLPQQHPKRVFMRRAVEYEIRLSYYDRIVKTLPEQMQSPDAGVLPPGTPGPSFAYDDPASPYHDAAQNVLNLLRGRGKAEEVMAHLEELKNTLETTDSDQNVTSVIRSIAVQALLHIGSRSFSHFLNAIERYLPLLRNLAAGGISTASGSAVEARNDILSAVLDFWKNNKHMVAIVLDKLMQYQIVDPTDVIAWTFAHASPEVIGVRYHSCSTFQWDLIKGALDKANGRVAIARRKLAGLRKEEDENAARAIASSAATMDIEETKPDPVAESPALTSAVKALTSLTKEQKAALTHAVDGFRRCLVSGEDSASIARRVIEQRDWDNRSNWGDAEWLSWETWSWYLQFCRMYTPYLRNYAASLDTELSAQAEPAESRFQDVLNLAMGQSL